MREETRQPQLSIEELEPPPGYDDEMQSPVPLGEQRGVAVIWPPADPE